MPAVTVNLAINVNAAAPEVEVFGQTMYDPTNVITVGSTLDKDLLNGLIKFQGQGDAIAAAFKPTAGADLTAKATLLANAIAGLLTSGSVPDDLDGTQAVPFSSYTTTATHAKFDSLGELMLSFYAIHLFGHPQATAAITNDSEILAHMNGAGLNLAGLLLAAFEAKTTGNLLDIVEQIIGKDAERAKNADNDNTSPDSWQDLEWKGGDKIVFQLTAKAPTTVTIAPNSGAQSYGAAAAGAAIADREFDVVITLA